MKEVSPVVVERTFERPKAFGELECAEKAVAWCLKQHEVRPQVSYLSLDGRSMICVYEAPDAESVRVTQRRGGLSFTRAWACTILPGPSGATEAPPRFSTVVVERDLPDGMTIDGARAMIASAEPCFDLHRTVLLRSHFSRDGTRMICIFAAPEADAVRRANAHAKQPFSRAWPATVHHA